MADPAVIREAGDPAVCSSTPGDRQRSVRPRRDAAGGGGDPRRKLTWDLLSIATRRWSAGAAIEFTVTLPAEVTMTEPISVQCRGTVVRVEKR